MATRTRSNIKVNDDGSLDIGGYCSAKPPERRDFGPQMPSDRMDAIFAHEKKWANGTKLRYYFFDKRTDGESRLTASGTRKFISWVGAEKQREVVRKAFATWAKTGMGLTFEEVKSREDAEIRIGFMAGDGAWSYLGRDVLNRGKNQRTMNFGWDLTRNDGFDTALHEIGHTLAMPHEHQNPFAGIVWDEAKVIADLGGPPNNWDETKTRWNILRKIDADTVIGSSWDPDSIMHYPFRAGMILEPKKFRTEPLLPAGGLSDRDKAWALETYPKIGRRDVSKLEAFASRKLTLAAGEQFNGTFTPEETRKYTIQSFGQTDTVLTVFEDGDKEVFLAGDDDSGEDFNSKITLRLQKGKTYLVRLRLFFSWDNGASAIMVS